MTPHPERISTETTIGDTMKLMTEKRTRHLPVFDTSGHLAGLVSIGDVTRWQSEENQAEADHLKNYVFGEFPPDRGSSFGHLTDVRPVRHRRSVDATGSFWLKCPGKAELACPASSPR